MAVADADVAALTSVQTVSASPRASARAAQNGARLMRSAQDEPTPAAPAPINRALARSYAIPDEDSEPSLDDLPSDVIPVGMRSNRGTRSEPYLDRASAPAPAPVAAPTPIIPAAAAVPAPTATHSNGAHLPAEPLASANWQTAATPAPRPNPNPLAARPEPVAPRPTPRRDSGRPASNFRYEEENQTHAANGADKEAMEDIAREIRMLRGLLESQIAGMAWGELSRHAPEKLEALRQLLATGFCPALSRQLVDKMPDLTLDAGMRWIKAALSHNLPTIGNADDLIARGGIYAFIGPTGVGKTTTVAKLAARCALQHGPESVALLTTDSYRIGAQDQLRIYGRIIGVPVHDVKDDTDLALTLSDLHDRHLVLIDTVGMGQRDQRISEQLAMFSHDRVATVLLLAANAAPATLDDVARRYKNPLLAGCILTKLDEAMSLGGCLDVAIRHRLALQFVTNGQRVPEDLHRANVDYLIDRAFRSQGDNPAFQLRQDEYPLYMGAQPGVTEAPLDIPPGPRRG
ncbi:flagellar biosynthesis protein FlhF [Silvimonas sp. JCM 19000]